MLFQCCVILGNEQAARTDSCSVSLTACWKEIPCLFLFTVLKFDHALVQLTVHFRSQGYYLCHVIYWSSKLYFGLIMWKYILIYTCIAVSAISAAYVTKTIWVPIDNDNTLVHFNAIFHGSMNNIFETKIWNIFFFLIYGPNTDCGCL